MTSEHERPLRRDAQRNRERVLAAAREVFGERGMDATLAEVAALAGVGVGTIYRRYPNKAALLDDLLDEGIAKLEEGIEQSLANPDPWVAFVEMLERLEEGFARNRAVGELLIGTEGGDERARARRARGRERLLAPMAALVERAKADGSLRPDFAVDDLSMIHTMLAAVVRETHASSPDLWRRYLAIIVDGLAAPEHARGAVR